MIKTKELNIYSYTQENTQGEKETLWVSLRAPTPKDTIQKVEKAIGCKLKLESNVTISRVIE